MFMKTCSLVDDHLILGGAGTFLEINILTINMLEINNIACISKKINNLTSTWLKSGKKRANIFKKFWLASLAKVNLIVIFFQLTSLAFTFRTNFLTTLLNCLRIPTGIDVYTFCSLFKPAVSTKIIENEHSISLVT